MVWYQGCQLDHGSQQVVLLRQKIMEGKTQKAASSSAAMNERLARKWQPVALPHPCCPFH